MPFFFETLSLLVLCFAGFLLIVLIILNIYLMKRNGFYISVNCWFCNGWTKVLYQERNSFNCPSCSQYNGFKEDGSYNKIIDAQHNISFTKYVTQKTANYENGLCTYCNNNQQLKMHQLAKFTPINEENYDLEIEHFQKQLEKAYKLCKKCEKVLKSTIDRQHSWLFGNRLRDLRKKGVSLMKLTKSSEVNNSYFLRFIRYILIILAIIILCHVLNVKVVYPTINWNKTLPTKVFSAYKILLVDFYNTLLDTVNILRKDMESLNFYLPEDIRIQTNFMTFVTLLGGALDLVLSFGQKRPALWKINGLFAWTLLMSTSVSFKTHLKLYVFFIQVFASLTLLCYYLWFSSIEIVTSKKGYHFKKLSKPNETAETSEEETDEEIPYALNLTPKSERTSRKSYRAYSPSNQTVNTNLHLTNSFSTAKSVTSTSELYNFSNSSNSDINRSLDNLHLTNLGYKSQRETSPIFSVNSSSPKRPLLSPSRLKNITQNPWTAGGFWKNDASVLSATIGSPNISRSSSQSSGFVSTHDNPNNIMFSSLPASREASSAGDADRFSVLSEPPYHFSPISPTLEEVKSPRLYYKADNNTFYPVLSQNNMLFIQNGVPQQSFGNSSLASFNTMAKSVVAPSVFSEKTISPLFKNLKRPQSFQKPLF